MEITQEQNLYAEIVQKAWGDLQFKSDLLINPVATIEQLTGQKANIPQDLKFVVVDQSDESTFYFNIPRDPRNMELTEEQMEAIAGGADIPYVSTSDLVHDLFCNATIWVRNQL